MEEKGDYGRKMMAIRQSWKHRGCDNLAVNLHPFFYMVRAVTI
jgi:hypothetical protein